MFGTEGVLHYYLDQHGYSHGLQNITLANATAWLLSIQNITLAVLLSLFFFFEKVHRTHATQTRSTFTEDLASRAPVRLNATQPMNPGTQVL
jgi:hypothetical protein